MGKILVIASVVISLATAGLGFVNKNAASQTKQDLADTQSAKQAADKKAAEADAALKTKTNELATAVAAQQQAESQASDAQKQLTAATSAAQEAKDKVTGLETQVATLTQENTELKDKVAAAAGAQVTPTTDPNQELMTRLQEQEAVIAKLQNELESSKVFRKEVEIEKKARTLAALKPGTEGRVLAVNPAWNFVVLSLGDKQGVVNNTELLVKRGTRYLGKVRITSVEPSTSIADIVANSMPQGTTITPGDNVIFQGEAQ